MSYVIEQGEVVEVLRGFRDCSFDALLCDPPYGFSFMGKAWDYDVPSVDLWRECLRVLKPGAPLVAFGGSRTYHRLACGVEDAGFELRDCMMWLHGTGFPKSQNIGLALDKSAGAVREVIGTRVYGDGHVQNSSVSIGFNGCDPNADQRKITAPATELAQQWDGYGTALKPAHEPIVLARKPLEGTTAANVARYGVGGLNIDGCRIGTDEDLNGGTYTGECRKSTHTSDAVPGARPMGRLGNGIGEFVQPDGRWPANLILSHDEGCRPTGATRPGKNGTAVKHRGVVAGTGATFGIAKPVGTPDAGYGTQEVEVWECTPDCPIGMLDASVAPTTSVPYSGGPSRFFYCAKVSTKEREAGCDHLVKRTAGEMTERADLDAEGRLPAGLNNPRAGAGGQTGGARNHHPTLKPISLTTWLARLIMPPTPGVILVPFAGAGSEMIGCLKAGWPAVFGIEREAEYVEIARARLKHWCPEGT